jgi:hypothetical protein
VQLPGAERDYSAVTVPPSAASADAFQRTVERPILLVDLLSPTGFAELIVVLKVVTRRVPMTDRGPGVVLGAIPGFRSVHNSN